MSGSIVVLGAGPAGLAFAYGYGRGAVVLEKSAEVGGLSRSIEIEDGVFDIGGHSFHTPHPEVLTLVRGLMKGQWYEQSRDARVWVGGQLIPYPFQRHFEMLHDRTIVQDCRGHVVDSESVAGSTNFEEWICRRFGRGVAKNFMLPYNSKQWAHDLKDMSCDWVVERVATDTANGTGTEPAGSGRRPLQADSRIAYPAKGGFGGIFVALAARCDRIELGQEVVQVDPAEHVVRTAAGQIWPSERIVSTIPLPVLLGSIKGCPERIVELGAKLRAVSLKILLILARLRDSHVPQRIYISDPTIPPHKVTFNHTSSPDLSERRNHAIMCEVSYSPEKPAKPDAALLEATIDWLIANRFIESRADIAAQKVVDVPYGYPVPTHAKPAIVAQIAEYLGRLEIYSIGRFGSWSYANSDECVHQGLGLARRLGNSAGNDPRA